MTNTAKNIITAAVVAAIIIASYFLFVRKGEEPESAALSTTSAQAPASEVLTSTSLETRESLLTLRRVQGIKVDTEVLVSNVFTGLEDYRVDILPQDVGRSNPFAPVGID